MLGVLESQSVGSVLFDSPWQKQWKWKPEKNTKHFIQLVPIFKRQKIDFSFS